MADTKITALAAITTVDPAADVLPIVDISDTSMAASGTTKKITSNQILGAGGTATLASATITGNLTVDTNTFFVDSANNRVGIGTASPGATFSALIGSEFLHFGFGANNDNYYTVGASGTHIWRSSSTEQMRLNSTGLGVGVSPSYNLDVRAAAATANVQSSTGTNAVSIVARNTGGSFTLGKENSVGGGSGVFGQDAYASVLWSTGAYPIAFGTNGAQRMLIDSTGNVGIGVTPSAWGSNWKANHVGTVGSFASSGAGSAPPTAMVIGAYNDNTNWKYQFSSTGAARYEMTGANAGSAHAWYISPGGSINANITFTQAMTLDASGNLLVGTTTTSGNAGGLKLSNVAGNLGQITFSNNSGSSDYVARFNWGSTPTLVGNITVSSGGTAFNTTSDYRLKESVQPLLGGLARVNALKPSVYKWKTDGSNGEGFLAHELAEVVPAAVTGDKDAVNEDGSIKPQGVDLSKVVPILVAAIKELTAEVNALKNA